MEKIDIDSSTFYTYLSLALKLDFFMIGVFLVQSPKASTKPFLVFLPGLFDKNKAV